MTLDNACFVKGKMMNPLYFTFAYIAPISVFIGCYSGGVYTFLTLFLTFLVIPILDMIFGLDLENPLDREQQLRERKMFRIIIHVYVVIQFTVLLWCAHIVSHQSLSYLEFIGITVSVGITTGGIGITCAHELGHHKYKVDRFLSKALLMTVCYMHFMIEHNRGHHANVATETDPATARLGESVYSFYPRTILYSYLSACNLERERLQKSKKNVWSIHNQMIWFTLLPIVFSTFLYITFSVNAVIFFFLQGAIAIWLLETVNYLEHYGLRRRPTSSGKYEKVNPLHSWNSNYRLTNYMLFKLQRHSDHHAHATRPYQILRAFDESPQLPAGYPGMIILALFPFLWRKIMDPRVAVARKRLEQEYSMN